MEVTLQQHLQKTSLLITKSLVSINEKDVRTLDANEGNKLAQQGDTSRDPITNVECDENLKMVDE